MKNIAKNAVFSAATGVFGLFNPVLAHEGHGLSGSHWHASDVASVAVLGVLIALAVWLSKK